MSFFADMDTVTLGGAGANVRAVGWLDPDHPITTGEPPGGFVDCLQRFVQASRTSGAFRSFGLWCGGHQCEFCDDPEAYGHLNIGVPFRRVIFIAPELVVHYVSHHHYLPPRDFITAVMESSLPGTDKYRVSLARFLHHLKPSPEDELRMGDSIRAWRMRYKRTR